MKSNPITADGIHQTSRDVLLGHALAGVLANPSVTGTGRERRAIVAAKLAIEAVDELIRLENEHDESK
jgi:hypothetical protein